MACTAELIRTKRRHTTVAAAAVASTLHDGAPHTVRGRHAETAHSCARILRADDGAGIGHGKGEKDDSHHLAAVW